MINYNKISQLKNENPYYADIIGEIESYYNMTIKRINHEFGNALTLVNSSLQIIESSHPEVHNFKYWSSAMADVRHMVNLVTEISTYNNSNSLKTQKINIVELLSNVIDSFSINPAYSHISFNMHINKSIPLIYGDDLKLRQVIINLLKNASESITENGIIDVNVSLISDNTHLSIDVTDNGCGLSEEQINNIFTPMISYKANGTGLGLPITKKIVEAHNGVIDVNSVLGKGSTFTIILPMPTPQMETIDPKA
ncbi:MAG: two-component sensor histidine kinase [Lachnospiraceae bacterium]|nr:two-component sensor histidine kinase [Lachnospiraceae bacterium]